MYPVSARFLASVRESGTPVAEVILFKADGTVEILDYVSGTVTVDRGQSVRRTCSVAVADTTLIPRTPKDKLSVYGARLRITKGWQYTDGTREMVPQGVFRVDNVEGDVDEGPVTIQGKASRRS